MTTNEPNERARIARSRSDRVLGGVCGGVARGVGVDPVLVRIAAVLIGLVSGGAAVLAYLVAWVLLPQAPAGEPPRHPRAAAPAAGGVKEAWTAVGGELKALAAELRPKQAGKTTVQPEGAAKRPPFEAVDAALTGFGERLRAPEVQEGARRTLAGLSAAVDASVEEIGGRVRRDRPQPPGPAGQD